MKYRLALTSSLVILVACGTPTAPVVVPPTPDVSVSVESSLVPSLGSPTTFVGSSDGAVEINVTVGVDSGADRVVTVPQGASVTILITNPDEDDRFHLHGYDLDGGETPAGGEAVFNFTADMVGTFELESHATDEVLLILIVG